MQIMAGTPQIKLFTAVFTEVINSIMIILFNPFFCTAFHYNGKVCFMSNDIEEKGIFIQP